MRIEHLPNTALLLPRPEALVIRQVAESSYLRPSHVLEMLTEVTTPIRTTAIPIGKAIFFGELPGRYSPAGPVEDVRVGGESCHRAADVGRCLGGRKVRTRLCERCGPRGGEKTGPNPTDRGKSGSKRHILVDRSGVPLVVRHSAANVHDSRMLETMLDAVSPLRRPRGRPGRPRKRPEKLHADKGYDFDHCREALRQRGIAPRIARRGLDSSERLGRHRWVAERTLAWLNRYRRLKVCYERLADMHQAFLSLGCALVCWNFVRRACEVG